MFHGLIAPPKFFIFGSQHFEYQYSYQQTFMLGINYFPKYKYRIALNADGLGTQQMYPRTPLAALKGYGDHRGLDYFEVSKIGELANGNKLNTPFL